MRSGDMCIYNIALRNHNEGSCSKVSCFLPAPLELLVLLPATAHPTFQPHFLGQWKLGRFGYICFTHTLALQYLVINCSFNYLIALFLFNLSLADILHQILHIDEPCQRPCRISPEVVSYLFQLWKLYPKKSHRSKCRNDIIDP